jgi:hypothetical protein
MIALNGDVREFGLVQEWSGDTHSDLTLGPDAANSRFDGIIETQCRS